MAYITLNGVDHYYEWICDGPPGHRPTLVFLHGWGGSARYWESTAKVMKHDFDCLLYDLRGFGRSKATPNMPPELGMLESFADDLECLLNALKLEDVFLIAHSMGASVALYFLNCFSQRVNKAILTCNGSFEYDKHAFEAFQRFGSYVVAFRPSWLAHIPLAPQIFMSRFLKGQIPYADKKVFLNDFLQADTATAMGTLKASVSKHATDTMPTAFSSINIPTLMISGQYDKITPAELGRQAASLNTCIEYVEVPETGHFPMLEDATTYLSIIQGFLHRERLD
ncbi:alpha/beta fold hydrolase [Leptothoe spongobia]|uniref:Alpha/beta hydrolase n=1 Tax=Leptothoe spongobia TAU-MAC 1115 TaxID=1967444 RepID=A0A947GI67_9CYAN|nr:alpha/beta hydrolase [Leptothoe spongobia]MBT9315489.1 alpha/beta hydrolase [Leptothoe spongobia TAU-MAC 1115]